MPRGLLGDYSNEPTRWSKLMTNQQHPFNAEPPSFLLTENFITTSDSFFVRNHGAVPALDGDTHKVHITTLDQREVAVSLAELRTMGCPVTIEATLMCAENRRNELKAIAPVKGVGWNVGAVGNATWSGIRLRDVLLQVKADVDDPRLHVEFVGEDMCEEGGRYTVSIPMSKAGNAKGDVLLAWNMNGMALTRDHGFPLRLIVPGYVAARSVKWLKRINILTSQSPSHFQQQQYKLFPQFVNWTTIDKHWNSIAPLSELSIQSAICLPADNTYIAKGSPYTIEGYAISNGRRITRVDVSLNCGHSWQCAEIISQDDKEEKGYDNRYWSWTLWKFHIEKMPSPCSVSCRAWDEASNTQPESARTIWNLRGLMNNAWHTLHLSPYATYVEPALHFCGGVHSYGAQPPISPLPPQEADEVGLPLPYVPLRKSAEEVRVAS
ncbi:hypothetical protein RvY_12619 [Ramazzottius varieornatus]|uniref:Sulfite oxidase n=1 Tax=Ramazzottius varieornatus TaxID=947166 RepID=A0A1D1VM42_RAMVA|nr:hypothetical protein RvY_12619 [Ramazzottius varieornatus]